MRGINKASLPPDTQKHAHAHPAFPGRFASVASHPHLVWRAYCGAKAGPESSADCSIDIDCSLPGVLRPGIVGLQGSMVIRMRPCMIMSTPPPSTLWSYDYGHA